MTPERGGIDAILRSALLSVSGISLRNTDKPFFNSRRVRASLTGEFGFNNVSTLSRLCKKRLSFIGDEKPHNAAMARIRCPFDESLGVQAAYNFINALRPQKRQSGELRIGHALIRLDHDKRRILRETEAKVGEFAIDRVLYDSIRLAKQIKKIAFDAAFAFADLRYGHALIFRPSMKSGP